jgi:hypothetical protein
MNDLAKKRDEYIKTQTSANKDGFDSVVKETLEAQLK